MKAVNVKNVVLQFDLENDVVHSMDSIKAQVEMINLILSEQFSWSQPQLLLNDDVEVEIIDLEM